MSSRHNFLDADNSIMERNLRFVKNDLEENLNQYFGSGPANRSSNSSIGSVAVPPRDYKVVQPKPGVFSNFEIDKNLKERKEFLQRLGLARHEAYELAKIANFNVQQYLRKCKDLLECGATQSQILISITNDIRKHITHKTSNEIQTPPPPPPFPCISNLHVENNDCSTNKNTCNRVSGFREAPPIERNGNSAKETVRDDALFFRRNSNRNDNWQTTRANIKEDALSYMPVTKSRTEQDKINPNNRIESNIKKRIRVDSAKASEIETTKKCNFAHTTETLTQNSGLNTANSFSSFKECHSKDGFANHPKPQRPKLRKISQMGKLASQRSETAKTSEETSVTLEKREIINTFKESTPIQISLPIRCNSNITNSNSTKIMENFKEMLVDAKVKTPSEDLNYVIIDVCNPGKKLPAIHRATVEAKINEKIMQYNTEAMKCGTSRLFVKSNKFVNAYLILTLENDTCVNILKKIIEGISPPWQDGKLTIVKQSELCLLTKATLLLPPSGSKLTNDAILSVFEEQNKGLYVNKWKVFYRKDIKEDGTLMIIGLDESSIQNLLRQQDKARFLNAHIHFEIDYKPAFPSDLQVNTEQDKEKTQDLSVRRPKSIAELPIEPSDPNKILNILQKSNPQLPTQDWKVVKVVKTSNNSIKALVILNEDSLLLLQKSHGKVYYGFGTAVLQVYPDDDN